MFFKNLVRKDMIQILGFPELLFSLDWHLGVSKSKTELDGMFIFDADCLNFFHFG
eukprot:UN08522